MVLWEVQKWQCLWYIDSIQLCPTFLRELCCSGNITEMWMSSIVGTLCPAFPLWSKGLNWMNLGGSHLYRPLAFFSVTITAQLGFHQGVCWAHPVFRHRPVHPDGVQMKYATASLPCCVVAAQLGFKPACSGCVLHSPTPWKHSWGDMRSPIPPQPEHHSLSSSESWGNPPELTVTKKLKHSIWNELPIFANLCCLQSAVRGGKIFICNCCFSSTLTPKKALFRWFYCCFETHRRDGNLIYLFLFCWLDLQQLFVLCPSKAVGGATTITPPPLTSQIQSPSTVSVDG